MRHLHAIVLGSAEPGLGGRMAEYVDTNGNLHKEAVDGLIAAAKIRFEGAIDVAMKAWGPEIRDPAGLATREDMRKALDLLPARITDLFERCRMQIVDIEKTVQTHLSLLKGDKVKYALELKRRLLGLPSADKNKNEADDRTSGHPMRRFAEFGILPGYEFPSEPCTIRLLGDPNEAEAISVERRFGLSQYRPGAQAHARGHRWKVMGLDLSSPWNPRTSDPDWIYCICKQCNLRYDPQQAVACPRCRSDQTLVSEVRAFAYGGFVAVRDDNPVLEEEDRYGSGLSVEAYPQRDGQPMFRYDLPTNWFMELRRNETVRWLHEGKKRSALEELAGAPCLYDDQRGFYLCGTCGRELTWPDPGKDNSKGRKKPSKGKDNPYGHAGNCPDASEAPKPCALTTTTKATTLRLFVCLGKGQAPEKADEGYLRWGFSLGYALRTGMRQLFMLDGPEIEFSLETPWTEHLPDGDAILGALTFLDPAVGGSGFLDRAALDMHLVAQRAIEHLDHKDCETACYRCLKSYNNQRHHEHLVWPAILPDLEVLASGQSTLTKTELFDPKPWLAAFDAGVGSPLELAFLRLFEKHGIEVEKQVPVSPDEGGAPISVADFVVKGTKTAIYVDGAAFHQGKRMRRDKAIREKLRQGTAGWKVVEVTAKHLGQTPATLLSAEAIK
jgi:hypothetical protein